MRNLKVVSCLFLVVSLIIKKREIGKVYKTEN